MYTTFLYDYYYYYTWYSITILLLEDYVYTTLLYCDYM
jgi:hypothetical protein